MLLWYKIAKEIYSEQVCEVIEGGKFQTLISKNYEYPCWIVFSQVDTILSICIVEIFFNYEYKWKVKSHL